MRYRSYEQALAELELDTLSERRDKLCLKLAKNCLKYDQTKEMFPYNTNEMSD